MWLYDKKLQYPVSIKNRDMKMAKLMFAQYGGADSELSAGLRYLTQRYSMPLDSLKGLLTDIGTEGAVMLPLMGQGFHTSEEYANSYPTSVPEMFLSKCTNECGGTEEAVVGHSHFLPMCSTEREGTEELVMGRLPVLAADKHFSGLLVHTVCSMEYPARYSKNNQFSINEVSEMKDSHQEKIIRIFA